MKTQVVIIGGGPSGLLLGELLAKFNIQSVVLERQTRDYVLSRIRAGILEQNLVDLMNFVGLDKRIGKESFRHHGIAISHHETMFDIDFAEKAGRHVVVYGQTEITRDLYEAHETRGSDIRFNVSDVVINDIKSKKPSVSFVQNGKTHKIDCDFVAGCDGYHGVSRQHIPTDIRREYEKKYPFGWLGVLSETPPVHEELIYTSSERGFALCSMRNHNLSRYYIQVDESRNVEDWSDDAFWQELKMRVPKDVGERMVTGASLEKSIAPLRSFVCEPMQYGQLFLCGDAAHIVPPTGAKGLNSAAGDVYYLYQALKNYYDGDDSGIKNYSVTALARVWKTQRFSWWMTAMLHTFPSQTEFDKNIQTADIALLRDNQTAQKLLAENYVGLPY